MPGEAVLKRFDKEDRVNTVNRLNRLRTFGSPYTDKDNQGSPSINVVRQRHRDKPSKRM